MAKCVRCGKSLLMSGKYKLKDGNQICKRCFLELGYDWNDSYFTRRYYTWDLIKNGKAVHMEHDRQLNENFRKNNPELVKVINSFETDDTETESNTTYNIEHNVIIEKPFTMANYGQKRDVNATDGEYEIYDLICKMFPDEKFELCRKSDDYVTAMFGEWDIVRMKYTDRAKWVMLPTVEAKQKKHYLNSVDEIANYEAMIQDSLNHAKKYEN